MRMETCSHYDQHTSHTSSTRYKLYCIEKTTSCTTYYTRILLCIFFPKQGTINYKQMCGSEYVPSYVTSSLTSQAGFFFPAPFFAAFFPTCLRPPCARADIPSSVQARPSPWPRNCNLAPRPAHLEYHQSNGCMCYSFPKSRARMRTFPHKAWSLQNYLQQLDTKRLSWFVLHTV